jgi:phage-related holin
MKYIQFDIMKLINWIGKALVWLWLYLNPAKDYATTIFLLIVIDTITGVLAAHHTKIPICLKQLLKGFLRKFAGYFLAIIVCINVDISLAHSWIAEHVKLIDVIGISIIFIELKSNLENISTFTDTDLWNIAKDRIAAALNLDKTPNSKDSKGDE